MYKQLFPLLLIISLAGNAQQPKIKPVPNKKMPLNTNAIGVVVSDIQLFERPDYQGKNGHFTKMNDGTYKAPFPLTDCSFKIPNGKIVYVKSIFEFPTETPFTNSQRKINLGNVIGIRSDDKVGVIISLDGISTAIHNNDCKKVYGKIKILLQENAPDADSTMSNHKRSAVPDSRRRLVLANEQQWTFIPWDFASAASVPADLLYSNYADYILNNTPASATPAHPEWRDIVRPDPRVAYFECGKKAIQEGRLRFHFTTDIGSAHKTCDICDDFSSRVKMRTPAYQTIPLRNYYGSGELDTGLKNFSLGPYEASGSRDGSAITASAGTIKQFKVYYSMKLHQP